MLSAEPAEEVRLKPSDSVVRAPHPTWFPFHVVPGISNFRDVGGWPIASTDDSRRHVRRGILYRGSDTVRITPDGEAKLSELGVKMDFDLRSKQQIEKTGGYREIKGVERVWTPVFKEEDYTEDAARQRYELYAGEGTDGIVTAFMEILTAGAPMFHTVLTTLLSSPSDDSCSPPALFMHCTTGNNRTGVFIALLLLLLRVPAACIVQEYTLSNPGLAPTRHSNVERLLEKGAFSEYGAEEARRKCERMVGARAESMEALLAEVGRRWGGAEGYFGDVIGLSGDEMSALRSLFTAEED